MNFLVPARRAAAAMLLLSSAFVSDAGAQATRPVTVVVDAATPVADLKPIWRFFGADEPNYATMKDGRKLLTELGRLRPREVYFRAHNLLCTGDGTPALKWGSTNAYTEDADGRPVYDWRVVDHIFDTYLERGVRPFVQVGFMPQALSTHPEPYQHEWRPGLRYEQIITGWAYPPKDYDRWRELAYQWTKHCIERYGREEVEGWYWEVWNEANGHYWKGTPEEWYKLHDYAIDGIRRALPTARVGGPHTAGSGGEFMDGFLRHVVSGRNYATGETGTPTDFLAFHAKGQPQFVDGHVRLGMHAQLKALDNGFRKIAAVPELKGKPIIIGESDPDGCAACQGPQLGYRAGAMYASYVAASFYRHHLLAERHGVNLEGALTWAFEFEDQPYFAGQRVLATNGIDLAVLNVYRMYSRMSGQRLAVTSSGEIPLEQMIEKSVREQADVAALASRDGETVCVMLWHYHDDDVPAPAAEIEVAVRGLPGEARAVRVTRFQIDDERSNAFGAWKKMGSPREPNEVQYAHLKEASRLARVGPPEQVSLDGGVATLKLALPRQAVALLVLESAGGEQPK